MTNNRAKALEALESWFRSPLSQGFVYDGMKEKIREALTEPQWKTMDSAPRDTRILTYYHGEIAILNKQLALKNSKTVCHKWHYDDGDEACTPQKWMPLPSPPTGEES